MADNLESRVIDPTKKKKEVLATEEEKYLLSSDPKAPVGPFAEAAYEAINGKPYGSDKGPYQI